MDAAPGPVVIEEDFSQGMTNWWVEGGEQVWVENGRLFMRSDGSDPEHGSVCTAWCNVPHPADFVLDLDARVRSSGSASNNINLFFCYADPSGKPLFESRTARRTADYPLYHGLNGHILTFLNGGREGAAPDGTPRARVRIRRCPGFRLLNETFVYHCRQEVTYSLRVIKQGGEIAFEVDGQRLLAAQDPEPLGGGLLGLRTYRTFLSWGPVRLRELVRGQ